MRTATAIDKNIREEEVRISSAAGLRSSAMPLQDNRPGTVLQKKQVAALWQKQAGTTPVGKPVIQLGVDKQAAAKRRKTRHRHAKAETRSSRGGMRYSAARVELRERYAVEAEQRKKQRVDEALRRGTYRRQNAKTKEAYEGYPEGSYAHGRWLYLNGSLTVLGQKPKMDDLIDFDNAPVEIDHSPHDASQRNGARVIDEASKYRVAVPLPRGWHRRHKTTHGAGATRYSREFSQEQTNRVANNNYAEALKEHLLDTLSDGAIGATGPDKIVLVAKHMLTAVEYAAGTDIAQKIHAGHTADQPAIDDDERTEILAALFVRMNDIINARPNAIMENPFEE